MRGDIARLGRCTKISTEGEDTIRRSKPFKYTYEKEIVMYAYFKKLDYFSTECVYSPEAFRGHARTYLKDLEAIRPSVIIDIIHSGEALQVQDEVKIKQQRQSCFTFYFLLLMHSAQVLVHDAATSPVTKYVRLAICWRDWNGEPLSLLLCVVEAYNLLVLQYDFQKDRKPEASESTSRFRRIPKFQLPEKRSVHKAVQLGESDESCISNDTVEVKKVSMDW